MKRTHPATSPHFAQRRQEWRGRFSEGDVVGACLGEETGSWAEGPVGEEMRWLVTQAYTT